MLRDELTALRNNRSFAGISGKRLELLEDRLKSDIINELKSFDGRLLCHQEQDDGSVVPVWESAQEDNIKTLREMMVYEGGEMLQFYRLVRNWTSRISQELTIFSAAHTRETSRLYGH